LYVAAESIQALFGGMWLWQANDNTWELVTLNIGRKMYYRSLFIYKKLCDITQ
jgi:hypothetical protein